MNNSTSIFVKRFITILFIAALVAGCSKKTSEEHMDSAQAFIQAGDVNAAVIELKSAVQSNPQSPEVRFELGKVYLDIKDFDSAEKELRRAMDLGYSASEVIPLLSVAYQRTGAHNALAEVDHQLEQLTSAEQAEVGFYKLQSLIELEETDKARELIAELKQIETASVYKPLALIVELILDEDNTTALEQAKLAREQSPLNRDALIILARLHLSQQQVDEAIEVYVDYLSQFPEDSNTKFIVASMLLSLIHI